MWREAPNQPPLVWRASAQRPSVSVALPLRHAVPASRKPGVAVPGHPCDACVAPAAFAAFNSARPPSESAPCRISTRRCASPCGHCATLSLLRASPGWPSRATRATHASHPRSRRSITRRCAPRPLRGRRGRPRRSARPDRRVSRLPAELVGLSAQKRGYIQQILRFYLGTQTIAHGALPLYGRPIQHSVIRRRHR